MYNFDIKSSFRHVYVYIVRETLYTSVCFTSVEKNDY